MPSPIPIRGPSHRPNRSLSADANSLIPRMNAAATMPATSRSPIRSALSTSGSNSVARRLTETPDASSRSNSRRTRSGRSTASDAASWPEVISCRSRASGVYRSNRSCRAYGPRNAPRLKSGSSRTPMPSIIRKNFSSAAISWGSCKRCLRSSASRWDTSAAMLTSPRRRPR